MNVPMVDTIWFPPINVAAHYHADFKDGYPRPKKIDEMMTTAIALAALQESHGRPYWIQGVPDVEQSPDVRTMFCDDPVADAAPLCYQQDVEIVTYTNHSLTQTLPEFVASTKLANTAGYDAQTVVLVNVQASVKLGSESEWSDILGATGKKNQVLVLGLVNKGTPLYRLASVHPPEAAIDYNPYELLKKTAYTKVRRWRRRTKNSVSEHSDEKHCPFEKFGVTCRLI